MNIYNTQPLLNEIEIVIKNGLDKMLSKILQRYDLLEKTHNQLMNLPSIKEALGKDYDDQDVESESEFETESNLKSLEFDNIVSCQTTMKFDVLNIESKLDKLEKKYAGLYPMLDKILDKIETLNNDVQKMKSTPISTISSTVEPTIVTACENENITFEIKEEDTESVEEDTESVEVLKDVVAENVEVEDTESVEEEVLKDVVVESVEDTESVEVLKDVVAESVEEEENDDSKSVETETKSDTESVEDEEDLEVITIDDIDYCTNNEENGFIWELTEDGEQGAKVGYLKDGEPFFYAEEN
jgi:hypothetical protein